MKRRFYTIIIFILMIMTIVSCGVKKGSMGSQNQLSGMKNTVDQSNSQVKDKADEKVSRDGQQPGAKIITTGEMSIIANEIEGSVDVIQKKCSEFKGYVENQNIDEYECNTVYRIPSENFNGFVKYLRENYETRNISTNNQNITEVYVDNEARLNNLKAQEVQILDILKTAKTVDEVLKVQSELYRIRGDIEALESRKKSWDSQIDYSTLTVRMMKKQLVRENSLKIIGGKDFINTIKKGFSNSVTFIILAVQKIIIFFLSNIIILAISGIVLYFVKKKYWNKIIRK